MNQKQAFEEALKLTEGCSDQFRMGFAHGQKDALEWFKQGQEPVAYAQFLGNGNIRIWTSLSEEAKKLNGVFDFDLSPLYTHPAPAQPAVAELVEACKLLIRYHETADGVNMKSYFDAVKAAYSALKAVKES